MPDRVEPGFFESDEEGYWSGDDEAGPDGKALGMTFTVYIEPPNVGLSHYWPALQPDWDGFEFTDDEIDAWPQWMERQYPHIWFNADAMPDQLTAEVGDTYRDGEGTEELYWRIASTPGWVDLHNRWNVYYHGLCDYITHCRAQREEAMMDESSEQYKRDHAS